MEGIKDNSGNEQLLSTIQELLSVKNQETHLNFIREHPELLSKEADRLLLELIESQENEDSRRYFEKQRDLLQKFRELGVDSVFPKNPTPQEQNGRPPANLELRNDLQQALHATKQLKNDRSLDAFNKAIQAWEKVISNPEAKNNFELYGAASAQTASLLMTRYKIIRNKKDIDYAITLLKQSINIVSPNSQLKPRIFNTLGNGLRDRYFRTGDIKDFEEAIENFKKAVSLTPQESPELPGYLNNLGNGLRDRYFRTRELKELEEAIEKYNQAVSLTPPEAPSLPGHLTNLGTGLRDRYSRTGDLKDLEEAIEKYKQAVSLTPPESPEMPIYLNNLGNGLSDLYSRSGDLKELEEAIEKYK
ncbi:tetratricopeptide repeat protein, partial [Methanosarcina sp. 1.H.T.1A.1]|uniref:tetratricopeptide repeat protein n=1 Tax=Methanosarcina sp. 1.H.T.1A.1 TaxID=1483602 RepID=UPI00064FED3B